MNSKQAERARLQLEEGVLVGAVDELAVAVAALVRHACQVRVAARKQRLKEPLVELQVHPRAEQLGSKAPAHAPACTQRQMQSEVQHGCLLPWCCARSGANAAAKPAAFER